MIRDFLDAAGIAEVVWIDDHFATMPLELAVTRIKRHLAEARRTARPLDGIPHFSALDLRADVGTIEARCDEVVLDLTEDQVRAGEVALGALVGAAPEPTPQPDLSPQEFQDMETAFGPRLRTYSGTRWIAEGVGPYLASPATVLFVIDKEFRQEPGALDGLQFLRDLLQRPNSFCIVLTYTADNARAQDTNRLAFATAIGVAPHRFCVISKAQDRALTVDQRFGRAIFEVFAHYLTGQLAFLLADAAAKATLNAVAEISSESIYDIDHAIFENSIEEGCSEIDVLLRIFRTRQKPKISELIRTAPVQDALRRLRDFRSKTLALRAQLQIPALDLRAFRRWRYDEVFDDRTTLNLLHSPLACGDLFDVELGGGRTKRYILLVQACALTVRGDNGKRTGQVGLLVPISEVEGTVETEEDEEIDESPYKFFDIKGVLEGGKIWRVDYRSTMFVPLKVLDLAVFNADGRVQILRDHPEPGVILPPGWRIRFETARRWFPAPRANAEPGRFPSPTKLASAIGHGAESIDPRMSPTAIVYPLSRTGRVEANLADAIYAAWAVYQTRAAFDHDFAKLEEDEPEGPDEPQPMEPPPEPPAGGTPLAAAPAPSAKPAIASPGP